MELERAPAGTAAEQRGRLPSTPTVEAPLVPRRKELKIAEL
jgi:hypothetical protein